MDFLDLVRTFVQVAEAGSLSRAARTQRLSLPAISRRVAALESKLGAELLVRTTRSLRLTDQGQRFLRHAARLLSEEDGARASVRSESTAVGDLVVSSSVTLGVLRIVPQLPMLLAQQPGLRLELRLEDRTTDLAAEGIDVAVRGGKAPPDTVNLIGPEVARYPCFVVASASYVEAHGAPKTVEELADHAAIVGISSPRTWEFRTNDKPNLVPIRPALRVGTVLGIRAAVVAGLGLAVLPHFAVVDELEAGVLRVLLPGASLPPMPVCAVYRAELRKAARVHAFVSHLRATLPTTPGPRRGKRR